MSPRTRGAKLKRGLAMAAGLAVLALAILGATRIPHTDRPKPRVHDHSAQPPSRRSVTDDAKKPALGQSSGLTSALGYRGVPVRAPSSLPTVLPGSEELRPEMREQLAQIAGSDWREVFSYMLGLMASYAQCMSDRPLNGKIYYYIIWKVEDGVGVDATLDAADDFPPEGNVTAEDVHAFYGCVDDYLQANASISLPHARTEAIWGMQATFPVHDARIYEMIAASKE